MIMVMMMVLSVPLLSCSELQVLLYIDRTIVFKLLLYQYCHMPCD